MNVPTIPRYLFKFGIKPQMQKTEALFADSRHGLHLAGFDVETIGTALFRKNDLYSAQIVTDNATNSHIFFPEEQGVENLSLFFETVGANTRRIFATAHNASFDIGALLGKDVYELMKGEQVGEWKGKVVDGNSSFAILRNKKKKQTLTIADSFSWFKGSLKAIAEKYFGEESQKKSPPAYLGTRAPKTKKEFEDFIGYAEQDAQIQLKLTKRIYAFCKEGNVKMCLTPAQLAGRVFQKEYLKDRIFMADWRLLDLIVRSYHGAQFTAFGRGFFKNIYYYDINSLYPFATTNVPLNFSNAQLKPMTLNDIEKGWVGFVAARFKFPDSEMYPCLPQYREIKKTMKMVFPLKGKSFCTTEEIKLALKKNVEILGWKAYGWYPSEEDITHPLASYMEDIYEKKSQLDKKEELTAIENDKRQYYKLLLNSLIGKFCQRNKQWLTNEEIAGGLFKPEFASLILSKSRAIINELVSKHGAIYSDTDCLMTKHSLPTGTEMGQLRNELGKDGRGDLMSIRSKLYFITKDGDVLKCAKHGFRNPSKEVFKKLITRRKKTYVTYSIDRLTRLKESYRRNMLARRRVNQTFKIMLKDDGKREYFEDLKTVDDLLNDSTMSLPLQNWG